MKKLLLVAILALPLILPPILLGGPGGGSTAAMYIVDDIFGGYGGSGSSRAKCWSHYKHSAESTFLQCGTCVYIDGEKKGWFYDGWCYFPR